MQAAVAARALFGALAFASFMSFVVVNLPPAEGWKGQAVIEAAFGSTWRIALASLGDRLFIGLLSAAWLNLAFVAVSEKMIDWFSLEQEPSIWISSPPLATWALRPWPNTRTPPTCCVTARR